MKLIHAIAGAIIVLLLGIWLSGLYLMKDDLRTCEDVPSNKLGCHTADAIVAVSGGDTTARTAAAIEMYQNGWAKYLVFSGAAADKTGPSNAEAMKRQALATGVPERAIYIEELSETTKQNAIQTSTLLNEHDIHSIILVTSAYHSRRVFLEFEKYAPSITVRSHPVSTDRQWTGAWWLTPSGWLLTVQELIKIAALKVGQ